MKNEKLSQEQLDSAYEEIENMLQTMDEIFFTNLEYFKKADKDIYKNIKKESKRILKDKSKEKFAVELNTNGSLDIINRKNNKFLYNKCPFKFGDSIAQKLTQKSIAFQNTGLGTHITSTIKINKPKKVLIIEPDIQKFRCSMYVTDYSELADISKIKFCFAKECNTKKYDQVYTLN